MYAVGAVAVYFVARSIKKMIGSGKKAANYAIKKTNASDGSYSNSFFKNNSNNQAPNQNKSPMVKNSDEDEENQPKS